MVVTDIFMVSGTFRLCICFDLTNHTCRYEMHLPLKLAGDLLVFHNSKFMFCYYFKQCPVGTGYTFHFWLADRSQMDTNDTHAHALLPGPKVRVNILPRIHFSSNWNKCFVKAKTRAKQHKNGGLFSTMWLIFDCTRGLGWHFINTYTQKKRLQLNLCHLG